MLKICLDAVSIGVLWKAGKMLKTENYSILPLIVTNQIECWTQYIFQQGSQNLADGRIVSLQQV